MSDPVIDKSALEEWLNGFVKDLLPDVVGLRETLSYIAGDLRREDAQMVAFLFGCIFMRMQDNFQKHLHRDVTEDEFDYFLEWFERDAIPEFEKESFSNGVKRRKAGRQR